jgi:hypothetical protein
VQAFAGVDLSSGEPKALAARIRKSYSLVQRWRNVKTLVVDDGMFHFFIRVSMVDSRIVSFLDGQYFDNFEAVARAVRFTDKHFGGIQVCYGHFYLRFPVFTHHVARLGWGLFPTRDHQNPFRLRGHLLERVHPAYLCSRQGFQATGVR